MNPMQTQYKPVAFQHFRAAVFHGATERCKQALVSEICCCTKVNEFNAELFINDDVFIFDVTMYNAQRIQIGERRHQLQKQIKI